jgi:hypothetical protein
MDTELLAIMAILVIAGWVALRIRESRRPKTELLGVPVTNTDDPDQS